MFKFASKFSGKTFFTPLQSTKFFSTTPEPVRVAVTGAAGQIGYAALFRIAAGGMLGPNQPVILHMLELPGAIPLAKGIKMELDDCAFPLLKGVVVTEDQNEGFSGVDYALLIGAKPRGPGMERADLLKDNAGIFKIQGKAINDNANSNIKVVVVGNPANTNALIASANAPKIDPRQFSALTVLDHNRGLAQLSQKTNTDITQIENFAIWGNHSPSMYPDISHCKINGKNAYQVINDQDWVVNQFIPRVQKRGAEVIQARGGTSSAASAASAAIEHMRNWVLGTNGKWASMGVWAEGNYGIRDGIYYSFPVICEGGNYKVVKDLTIDEFSRERMEATKKELLAESEATKEFRA